MLDCQPIRLALIRSLYRSEAIHLFAAKDDNRPSARRACWLGLRGCHRSNWRLIALTPRRVLMSNQPIIAALHQNHREAVGRRSGLAVTNSGKFVKPGNVGDVVIKNDDLTHIHFDLVTAFFERE